MLSIHSTLQPNSTENNGTIGTEPGAIKSLFLAFLFPLYLRNHKDRANILSLHWHTPSFFLCPNLSQHSNESLVFHRDNHTISMFSELCTYNFFFYTCHLFPAIQALKGDYNVHFIFYIIISPMKMHYQHFRKSRLTRKYYT